MSQNIGKIDEDTLLRMAREGDVQAVEQVVQRYSRVVRAAAHAYAVAGADAEDMMQEGMLGLLTAIRTFSPARGVPFSAYAQLCASRRMVSALRTAGTLKHQMLTRALTPDGSIPPDMDVYAQTAADPESLVIGMESQRELFDRLRSLLSHFEAQVLTLYLNGMSYEEIASALDRSRKSVDNAMGRVRRKASALIPSGETRDEETPCSQ